MPWGSIGGAAIGALGSLIGGGIRNHNANAQAALQYQHQKEFAQNGVRWKVEDANRAGIHPLAALGAQAFSYNPVMTQDSGNGVGEALARMGQGVDRAYQAKQLAEDRELDKRLKEAQIKQVEAQTDAVQAQAQASKNAVASSALPPAMPAVNEKRKMPSLTTPEPTKVAPGEAKTGQEGGVNPSIGWLRNPDGTLSVVQGQQAKEKLEDDFIGELSWSARNRLMPHLRWILGLSNKDSAPPDSLLPKGAKRWRYTGWNSWKPDYD